MEQQTETYLPLQVIANPFGMKATRLDWALGDTLEDMILSCGIDREQAVHVCINGEPIDAEYWHVVHPKIGSSVTINVLPLGDDSNGALRALGFIAVAVAAYLTGGYAATAYAAATGTTTTGIGAGLASAVATAAVTTVGMLAINALLPISSEFDNGSDRSQSLSIGSSRNRIAPFSTSPFLLGYLRIYPNQAALPYTKLSGSDQDVTMLFAMGYRNMRIHDDTAKIGDTLITSYTDVEVEYDVGDTDDQAITLYTGNRFQLQVGVALELYPETVTRTASPNAVRLEVDLHWLHGVIAYDDNEDPTATFIIIEYREAGTSDPWVQSKYIEFWSQTKSVIRRTYGWSVHSSKVYEVRCYATGPYACTGCARGKRTAYNQATWALLTSVQEGVPVSNPCAALGAINIRATDQLNGTPDTFNVEAESIFNGSPTNNPADLLEMVLTSSCANARPLGAGRIDTASFAAFRQWCIDEEYTFNLYVDYSTTVFVIISQICAAARARCYPVDGLWTVVIDKQNDVISQVLTPRNTLSYSGERVYPDEVHAFRVRFQSEVEGWTNSEVIVYADGYTEQTATKFEAIEFTGVTNPDQIWKLGRYWLKAAVLQPENFSIKLDVENLVSLPGDRIAYQEDGLLIGIGTSRVLSYSDPTMELDSQMPYGVESYGFTIRKSDGTVFTLATTPVGVSPTSTWTMPASSDIDAGDLAVFGQLGQITQDLLIKSITPGNDLTATLECVPYNVNVYNVDQETPPTYDPGVTPPLTDAYPTITLLDSSTRVMVANASGVLQPTIAVTYTANGDTANVAYASLEWRVYVAGDNPAIYNKLQVDVSEFTGFIAPVIVGQTYDVRIAYYYTTGGLSPYHKVQHTVQGDSTLPSDVVTFDVTELTSGGSKEYVWTVADGNQAGFEIRYMSATEAGSAPNSQFMEDGGIILMEDGAESVEMELAASAQPNWEIMHKISSSIILGTPFTSPNPVATIQEEYQFAIKAINSSGNYSQNATYTTEILLQ